MDTVTKYGPGDEATWGSVTSSRDPRFDDVYDAFDHLMTQGDCEETVTEEWLHNSEEVSDWLAKECTGHFDVSSKTELCDVMGLPVPRLVAVLMNGSDKEVLAASRELKERFVSANLKHIRAEAQVLWEKQWGSAEEAPCLWGQE